ncbi:MAG: hypothetical protein U0270_01245 [Labilithrix sp.]
MGFPPDVIELFEGGASIVIGTRDAKLRPEIGRACGAVADRKARRITVFLPEAIAAGTLANIAENGQIAVAFTEIFHHRSIQTKGKVVSADRAAEIHQDTIKRYMGAWAEALYQTGIPRAVTLQCATWPAVAITYDAAEVFVQTPGPKAGAAWKP